MYKQLPLAISPNRDATFNNFYIAEANQLAINTLQAFTTRSDELYLYLWGQQGSGITHLLEAVQNQASPALSIQYLPLKELINYSPADIIEGVDQLDMVCIDDLQLICGLRAWEEAIFYLFNRLRDTGKRLLIGSHYSPRNLPVQLADLQSRLQWGAVFNIHVLNDEDKYKAMQFRADSLGMELSDEVANYLLQRIDRSSAILFQLIQQLDQASLAEQRKLTIPFVKKVLSIS